MKIRHFLIPAAVALLFAASQAVTAQTAPQTQPDTRTIAVVVNVDSQGKITNMQPDVDLKAALNKLLHHTLEQMITKPAHDSNGKAIASQMVMQLTMNSTRRADGTYSAKFAYLKAKPLPVGRYVWNHTHNGHKPVLMREGALTNTSQADRARSQMLLQQSIAKGERALQQRQQSQNSSSGSSHSH